MRNSLNMLPSQPFQQQPLSGAVAFLWHTLRNSQGSLLIFLCAMTSACTGLPTQGDFWAVRSSFSNERIVVESASSIGSDQSTPPRRSVTGKILTEATQNNSKLVISRDSEFENLLDHDVKWLQDETSNGATWLSKASTRLGIPIELRIVLTRPETSLRIIKRHEDSKTAIVEIYAVARNQSEAAFTSSVRNAISTGLHESLHLSAPRNATAAREEYLATLFEICFLASSMSENDRLHLPKAMPARHRQSVTLQRSAKGAGDALHDARKAAQSDVVNGSDLTARENIADHCRSTLDPEFVSSKNHS